MKLYMNSRRKTFDAIAAYDPIEKKFVVLKGSRVSNTISKAPTFRSVKTVERLRSEYVKNNIVQVDVCFKSASSAAYFVTGSSTDGMRAWKDEQGVILKDIVDKC